MSENYPFYGLKKVLARVRTVPETDPFLWTRKTTPLWTPKTPVIWF